MLVILIIIEGTKMTKKDTIDEHFYCFCERKAKKLIYTAYDKKGNYATSPNSHQEAVNYLNQRKPLI